MTNTLITDTEVYRNFWSIGMKRVEDGKVLVLRKDADHELDTARLRKIVMKSRLVTFNGMGYDRAMIWGAIFGLSNDKLKELSDQIIVGGVRWWETGDLLASYCHDFDGWWPKHDFIDLIEPQPNAFASLKTLNGRLHGPTMRDLPYEPDRILTPSEMEEVISYMENDLDATHRLWDALKEPMELREALSQKYSMDLRSKSDSQIGEMIVKKRVEEIAKTKIPRAKPIAGEQFKYSPPDFISFESPDLKELLVRLQESKFVVKANFKVDLPAFLTDKSISIGETTYAMGIGGLHSTEANRSIYADDEHFLEDCDVAAYYPSIILKSGLYPKALGKTFLDVYAMIRSDRVTAKRRAKDIEKELAALRARLAELDGENLPP